MPTSLPQSTRAFSALAGLAAVVALPFRVHAQESARPNILWVVSEDNSPRFVGAYGDPLARTPTLDRLARNGIVFDKVYTAPVCAPSRSTIITGRYADGLGTQNMRSTRPLPEGVRFFPEFLREAGYFCTNNAKTDYNTSTPWKRAWDEDGAQAHWRHRRAGQPFFAVFNFMESHESALIGRKPLTTDPAQVRVPAYLPDTAVVRADLAQYYDAVSTADRAIARVLANLEADGLADDTIVFYYSDNGGAVAGTKRFLNEEGTHVAMIARFPRKYAHLAPATAGTRLDELVHLIDLAPTMLSLSGVPPTAQFQGRAFAGPARSAAPEFLFQFADRMDERYNLVRAVTDGRYRYVRNYHPDRPWGQHIDFLWQTAAMREWELHFKTGALNAAQRAFFEPSPAEALYDCASDPDNVRNLAADPAQTERVQRMRAALRAHQLAIRDTGFMPEPMMVEAAAGGSPAVLAADDARYPLARVIDLLDELQLGAPRADTRLADLACDPLPVVRYWAAVATLRGGPSSVTATLLHDADPVVRLTAAAGALRHADAADAWQEFENAIRQTQRPELRLFALDSLARIERNAPKSLAALLGPLSASDVFGGFDYYNARLARLLLADYGSFSSRRAPAAKP
ncbi:MAG: sulfatase [Candidatus Didemnitutus sp.]|nr:sulfatase [Candidatus Didemnitutus sp.]